MVAVYVVMETTRTLPAQLADRNLLDRSFSTLRIFKLHEYLVD
jgi:hypothetical protein